MFSVIIPYYKKRKYIERCIESVLNQTFKDFEIILIDDGSQDDISTVCKKYGEYVQLISQTNQGVSAARNAGITKAKNTYVAFLDADDYWSPFYLEYNHEVIINEDNVKILGSNYTRDKYNLETESVSVYYNVIQDYFSKQMFKSTLFFTSATIVNRSFFNANRGFNSKLKRGEDLDVWFRVIAKGGKSFYINNKLVYYSDEDALQVTQTAGKIEDSILYHYPNLYEDLINTNTAFKKSISKFIYLNLYPYFFSEQNHNSSRLVLQSIPSKFILMKLVYLFPVTWGIKLLSTVNGRLRIRQYLKFVAQHLS